MSLVTPCTHETKAPNDEATLFGPFILRLLKKKKGLKKGNMKFKNRLRAYVTNRWAPCGQVKTTTKITVLN